MPVLPAPLRHLPDRSVQTARRRLPLDHPRPAAIRPLPVVSEPKQIERSRATTAAAFALRLVGRFREPHQTSFLGMKLQTVFAESLRQYPAFASPALLSVEVSLTQTAGPMSRSCFPSTAPRPGASLPSAGSRGVRFSGFLGTIKALRLPIVLPASLPFVRRAIPRTAACRTAAGVAVRRLLVGTACRCLNPLPSTPTRGDDGISPGSSATPLANMLCSSTPADRMHQALAMPAMLPSAQLTASAPHSVTFRGSITRPVRSLSTLRGSDYSDRTPRKTRFPLVANLGGAALSPAGLLQEVSTLCFNSHRFLLLEALPGAPAGVTPSGCFAVARNGPRVSSSELGGQCSRQTCISCDDSTVVFS
jgi:hypothetical protein